MTSMTTTSKIITENIPYELKKIKAWTMWAFKTQKKNETSKPQKMPLFGPLTPASIADPSTWLRFNEVENMIENPSFNGVNFAFTKMHPYIGVDIDSCVDENGKLSKLAQTIVHLLNSYTEYSPSGRGIRIIVRAPEGFEMEDRNDQLQGIEIYKNAHFLSITGNTLHVSSTIEERSNEIIHILSAVLHPSAKEHLTEITEADIEHYAGCSEETSVILKRIFMNNKKMPGNQMTYGEYYEALYTHGYIDNDESTDDWKLACELVYQCAGDITKAKDIIETSAIYHSRDKWQENRRGYGTYTDMTLFNALRAKKSAIDKMIAKKQVANELHTIVRAESKPWWQENANGTRSFVHSELAQIVMQQVPTVHYPNIHSDLYIYNANEGIYEQDITGRQLNSIIRAYDKDLKISHIREVAAVIMEASIIAKNINNKYIAVANGLINLETFELTDFSPRVFLTHKIGTNYNPNAYDPFVESTLYKVTNGYGPSIANIKEMFACVFYSGLLVSKMFYLYGRTAHNGKSSILNFIHSTFNKGGNMISAVSPQKLATNTFAGASVYGKLANIVDDLPDVIIEEAGTLKSILTRGPIEIEFKGKTSESVIIEATMITASNFYPSFKENGKQINRRLHIIPFEHDFSSDPERKSEIETMQLTRSNSACEYVLKLAVDTLKQMLSNPAADKLTHNPKAVEAAESFALYNDPLADYFADNSDLEYFINAPGKSIYDDYLKWCENNHATPLSVKKFKERVCTEFDLIWKPRRANWNGTEYNGRGFAKK